MKQNSILDTMEKTFDADDLDEESLVTLQEIFQLVIKYKALGWRMKHDCLTFRFTTKEQAKGFCADISDIAVAVVEGLDARIVIMGG